jgi:alpha-tubulin suppressor-like RCC1 family protein
VRHLLALLRKAVWLLSALALGLGFACTQPRDTTAQQHGNTATVSFAIGMGDFHGPPDAAGNSSPGHVSALAFTYASVTRIRIDVTDTSSNSTLYINFDLEKDATGTWRGTLPFLPKNKPLSFHAKAHSTDNALLFEGTTVQTLSADSQPVVIVLVAANNNQAISLPRLLRIALPSELGSEQSGNVSFSLEGNSGEKLTYVITSAQGGGTFLPTIGAITLPTSSGTFVSQYVAPTVSSETTFTHEVLITNAAGHSLSTTFTTRVKPRGTTDGVRDTHFSVLFNPVINGLMAVRLVETDRVVWTADVRDDGSDAELRYAWSFKPTGASAPVPGFFVDAGAHPGILQGYTPELQGELQLSVTDRNGSGGTTTLYYPLRSGQFPDQPTVDNGFAFIRAGASHTCALFHDGGLRCWGLNARGQLGLASTTTYGDDEAAYLAGPVPLTGVGAKLAVGGHHTCALLDWGMVRCWGHNAFGQLGYNSTDNIGDGEPLSSAGYVNLRDLADTVVSGLHHTCALMSTGKVRCWGLNSSGQLGYGHKNNLGDNEYPYSYGDIDLGQGVIVKDLVAGAAHTCALLSTGAVRCWGNNSFGQLGLGHTAHVGDDETPANAIVNVGGPVRQLVAGYFHTCALLSGTNTLHCWGLNGSGQLGYGNTTDLTKPGGPVAVGGAVLQVAAGQDHTCALLSTGGIKCWGLGAWGQLGQGNANTLTSPPSTPVALGGLTAFQVTAGGHHTCALLSNGKARCWGLNNHGQLGYGYTRNVGDDELPSSAGDISLMPPAP